MFISWIRHHGRSESLARELGIPAVFMSDQTSKKPLLAKYWRAARETRAALKRDNPDVIYLMLPPAPALLAVLMFKSKDSRLVVDLHTGYFSDPKWSWFTTIGLKLMRKATVLVTNQPLQQKCAAHGVRAIVMHDVLTRVYDDDASRDDVVLCPLSYANDEPVSEIIEAARLCPDLDFVLTGNAPKSVREKAPSNVRFSGHVSAKEYQDLMANSLLVVAMTNRDHTMQRAGYEALMAGKPQVTADFSVLREYLGPAALYARPESPESISEKVLCIAADADQFRAAARDVLADRMFEQAATLEELRSLPQRPPAGHGINQPAERGA
ncbi:glycosyltransferase [Prescottella equi]|uniref:glycosyltransferase n=1 Tax=Rhodococcus hoagii TaxID=43767 RepID=UPI000A11EBBE|nr:glycosyltransferase [Prescottella equi]